MKNIDEAYAAANLEEDGDGEDGENDVEMPEQE